jgi:hypothetical protein
VTAGRWPKYEPTEGRRTIEDGADQLEVDITLEDVGPFKGAWRQRKVGESAGKARFRAHMNRMVEQLNRQR